MIITQYAIAEPPGDPDFIKKFGIKEDRTANAVESRTEERMNTTLSRSDYKDEFDLTVGTERRHYAREYVNSAHFHIWEEGKCGAWSCDRSYSGDFDNAQTSRNLYLKDISGKYLLVANKTWAISSSHQGYGKSCNDFMNENYPGIREYYLGSAQSLDSLIKSDY
jgi:hypothetical protein